MQFIIWPFYFLPPKSIFVHATQQHTNTHALVQNKHEEHDTATRNSALACRLVAQFDRFWVPRSPNPPTEPSDRRRQPKKKKIKTYCWVLCATSMIFDTLTFSNCGMYCWCMSVKSFLNWLRYFRHISEPAVWMNSSNNVGQISGIGSMFKKLAIQIQPFSMPCGCTPLLWLCRSGVIRMAE